MWGRLFASCSRRAIAAHGEADSGGRAEVRVESDDPYDGCLSRGDKRAEGPARPGVAMTKRGEVSCMNPKRIYAQNRKIGLTKHRQK